MKNHCSGRKLGEISNGPRDEPRVHMPSPVREPSSSHPHSGESWHSAQVLWAEQFDDSEEGDIGNGSIRPLICRRSPTNPARLRESESMRMARHPGVTLAVGERQSVRLHVYAPKNQIKSPTTYSEVL